MASPEISLPGRYRAAVFDFDGLLVDSEPGWARAESRLLARRGHAYGEADRLATVGRSIDESVAVYADRLGLAADARAGLRSELIELAREEYLAGFPTLPGAAELVGTLRRRIPVGVASNTDRALVEAALARTPLATSFTAIVTAEDVARPKPAPDVYQLACRLLGLPPSAAIAFEDSVSGVRSAKAAGLMVIAVPQHPGLDVSLADEVIDSLIDAMAWVS